MNFGLGEKFLLLQGGGKKREIHHHHHHHHPHHKREDKRNKLEEISGQLLCFTLSAECQGFAVVKIVKAQELVLTKN